MNKQAQQGTPYTPHHMKSDFWTGESTEPTPAGHYVLTPSGEWLPCTNGVAARQVADRLNRGLIDESGARCMMQLLDLLVA